MVNSLLHEWVGRLSVTGKTKIGLLLEKNINRVFFLLHPPPPAPRPTPSHSLPVAASTWRLHGLRRGLHGSERQIRRGTAVPGPMARTSRSTDAAPTQGRDPNHARLIQYICGSLNVLRPAPVGARCQPGWVSVALRFERAYDTLVTPFQLVSSSFPARFQLGSSSFVARFQLSSKLSCFSSWKSVKHSLVKMNSTEGTSGLVSMR